LAGWRHRHRADHAQLITIALAVMLMPTSATAWTATGLMPVRAIAGSRAGDGPDAAAL